VHELYKGVKAGMWSWSQGRRLEMY